MRWILLLLLPVVACQHSRPGGDVEPHVRAMEPADVYKRLHQAFMGPAHAAPPLDKARAWLKRERAALVPTTCPELSLEDLPGPHGLVRANLRKWPESRDDALARAFVETVHLSPLGSGNGAVENRERLDDSRGHQGPALHGTGHLFPKPQGPRWKNSAGTVNQCDGAKGDLDGPAGLVRDPKGHPSVSVTLSNASFRSSAHTAE